MKKLLVLLSSIMMLNNLDAQVGIGTENPTSTLDIKGSLQIAFTTSQ